MKLTVDELETCFSLLMEMLRNRGVESVETGSHNFYWSVLSEEWLDFQNEPDLAVGSLDDDFAGLKKLLSDPSRSSVVDLERLAAVLKLSSESLGSDQYSSRSL